MLNPTLSASLGETTDNPRASLRQRFEQLQDPSEELKILHCYAPSRLVRVQAYCRRCAGMASEKTCPHGAEDRVALSGTAVCALLRAGELPPPEFSRPGVACVLVEAMRSAD